MIEATRAQLPKQAIKLMVAINMNPMPPKVIRREPCLWARGFYGLSKDLKPNKHLNT